jgi:hypothetical protein
MNSSPSPGEADEQGGTSPELAAGCDTLVEGVLDLAFRTLGRWTLVDCSTFAARRPSVEAEVARCRRRLDLHGACWARITGEPVETCLVTSLGARLEG